MTEVRGQGSEAGIQKPEPGGGTRVTVELYREVRAWMLANDPDTEELIDWAENLKPPGKPVQLAGEIIWVILCAGKTAQAARTIESRVRAALDRGKPVIEAFGHRGKAASIEDVWKNRDAYFAKYLEVSEAGVGSLVAWFDSISYVGADTKWQLAKNVGADVCKPDMWLCRLAGFADRPRRPERIRFPACMDICRPLREATGDRIATVDTVLWLACNKRVLVPSRERVEFVPGPIARRSVYVAGHS